MTATLNQVARKPADGADANVALSEVALTPVATFRPGDPARVRPEQVPCIQRLRSHWPRCFEADRMLARFAVGRPAGCGDCTPGMWRAGNTPTESNRNALQDVTPTLRSPLTQVTVRLWGISDMNGGVS